MSRFRHPRSNTIERSEATSMSHEEPFVHLDVVREMGSGGPLGTLFFDFRINACDIFER